MVTDIIKNTIQYLMLGMEVHTGRPGLGWMPFLHPFPKSLFVVCAYARVFLIFFGPQLVARLVSDMGCVGVWVKFPL